MQIAALNIENLILELLEAFFIIFFLVQMT